MSPADGPIAAACETNRPLFSLIAKHGRKYYRYAAGATVTGSLSAVLSNLDMLIIGIAFDAMFNDEPYILPLFPDGMIPTEPLGQLTFTVALLAILKVFDIAFGGAEKWCWANFGERTLHRVRTAAFDSVQQLDMAFFDDHNTGDVMSVLNSDVNQLKDALVYGGELLILGTVLVGSSILYMLYLSWELTLLTVAVLPILVVLNYMFSARHRSKNTWVRETVGTLTDQLETTIRGIPIVKAFHGEPHERERVRQSSDEHRQSTFEAYLVEIRHRPLLRFVAGVAFVATFWIGTEWALENTLWVLSGSITAGKLIPFLYYTLALIGPMAQIANLTAMYKASAAAATRVEGIQNFEPERRDDGEELPDVAGHVEYDDVTFSYPGADETTLEGVSFDVSPGESIGVVGPTGAGKSTVVKLLLRFYHPDSGTIRVDGHDVEGLSVGSLRETIGYVSQDPFLFTGTIRENIAYGTDEYDDEDVIEAAKTAGAHRFISALEDGYDTEIGERGLKLSGGQRQRVAIARALLVSPPIIVFDEATSSVDNVTQAVIQRRINDAIADRTTITIAHRLATVRDSDRILYVEDGRLEEAGPHDELIDLDEAYAALWREQVGEDRKAVESSLLSTPGSDGD